MGSRGKQGKRKSTQVLLLNRYGYCEVSIAASIASRFGEELERERTLPTWKIRLNRRKMKRIVKR